MNSFINTEIDDLIKDVQGGGNTAQLKGKIEKQDFSDKMNKINDMYNTIINNPQQFKCLLVLSLKKVTWFRELMDKFNITKYTIERFTYYMEQNGFLINKQFIDLDNILYETILNTNPKELYKHINQTHLLTLTDDGIAFAKKVIGDAVKLNNRIDILNSINDIQRQTQAFRFAYEKVLIKENRLGTRTINFPNDIIIERITERQKHFDKEIKLNILYLKKELLLENGSDTNSLALIEDEYNKLKLIEDIHSITKNDKTEYTGIYSHLTNTEIETLMQPVSDKEERLVEKEYQQELNNKLKYQNKDTYSIMKVLNKEEMSDEEEDRHKRECLNFLNSLESCD